MMERKSATSSGRHNMIHRHNMSRWVKTTDLCFKTDYESVIFSDGSYYVRGSYYVYHWTSKDEKDTTQKTRAGRITEYKEND